MAGRSRHSKGALKGWKTRYARAAERGMSPRDYNKRAKPTFAGRAATVSAYVQSANATTGDAGAFQTRTISSVDPLAPLAGMPFAEALRVLAEIAEVLQRNGVVKF
jgi:hypothetical protein